MRSRGLRGEVSSQTPLFGLDLLCFILKFTGFRAWRPVPLHLLQIDTSQLWHQTKVGGLCIWRIIAFSQQSCQYTRILHIVGSWTFLAMTDDLLLCEYTKRLRCLIDLMCMKWVYLCAQISVFPKWILLRGYCCYPSSVTMGVFNKEKPIKHFLFAQFKSNLTSMLVCLFVF